MHSFLMRSALIIVFLLAPFFYVNAIDSFTIPDVNSLTHEQLLTTLKGIHNRLFNLGDLKESLIDELRRTGNQILKDRVAEINKEIAALVTARDQSFNLLGSTYKKSADYLDFQNTTKKLSTETLGELSDFHADRLTEVNNRIIPLQDSLKARRELLDYMDKEIRAIKALNGGVLPESEKAMQVLMQQLQDKQHGDKALQRALLYRQARDRARQQRLVELIGARTGTRKVRPRDMASRNAFPVDLDDGFGGFFPSDDVLQQRVKSVTPSAVSPTIVPKPGILSKALNVGMKTLKVLPLVGELWTRKENALLASAHALTESCISNQTTGAGTAAGYILGQYAYRGFGFLSLIPNLADTADTRSMQGTLNFLLSAGCFDEYREFVNNNKDVFADLGITDLQLLTPAEISKKEKDYEDMQRRLNTPLTAEEIAANRKAANDARARDLAEKKAAFSACCSLLATNACPLRIKNDLVRDVPLVSIPSDVLPFPTPGADDASVMTCSQLQSDIANLESRLVVP